MNDDNLRSGQAHHSTSSTVVASTSQEGTSTEYNKYDDGRQGEDGVDSSYKGDSYGVGSNHDGSGGTNEHGSTSGTSGSTSGSYGSNTNSYSGYGSTSGSSGSTTGGGSYGSTTGSGSYGSAGGSYGSTSGGSSSSAYGSSSGSYGTSAYGSTSGNYGSSTPSSGSEPGAPGNHAGNETQEILEAVDSYAAKLKVAGANDLKEDEGLLMTALKKVGNGISVGLTKLLGGKVSDEDIEAIAEEIEKELDEEATHDLETKANDFISEQVTSINMMVADDLSKHYSRERIYQDIRDREPLAVQNLRGSIHSAEEDMQHNLRMRAIELEKKFLEEKLSAALKRPVTLQVVENRIEGFEGMLDGVETLNVRPAYAGAPPSYGNSGEGGEFFERAADDDNTKGGGW